MTGELTGEYGRYMDIDLCPEDPSLPLDENAFPRLLAYLETPTAIFPAPFCFRVLARAKVYFSKQPGLIHLRPKPGRKLVVVGDLHGNLDSLLGILNTCGLPSNVLHYVFLGDYVDRSGRDCRIIFIYYYRGDHSAEIFVLLCFLAMSHPPGRVTLIRGNHESLSTTQLFGFFRGQSRPLPMCSFF